MFSAIKKFAEPIRQRLPRPARSLARVELNIDCGSYRLKTANSRSEILDAFRLRYLIFHHEMIGKESKIGIDTDEFDELCDHLLIIDKEENETVGTYRLNCSKYNSRFYTGTEFDISDILNQPGPHLELGRACIKASHRKGIVMSLLWKGIGAYMEAVNAQLLFGCASVKTTSTQDMALLYRLLLEKNYITTEIRTRPHPEYTREDFNATLSISQQLTPEERAQASKMVPPLLLSYLRLGSVISGQPAYDAEFKCFDFLTLLRREKLSPVVARKYQVVK